MVGAEETPTNNYLLDDKSSSWYTAGFISCGSYGSAPTDEVEMREGIHPKYNKLTVSCACGNKFETRSTKSEIRLEMCSACHPFFTGKQKLIDTAGRIE